MSAGNGNKGKAAWMALMAFLTVVAGASQLTDIIDARAAGLFVIVVAGLQAGTATYWAWISPESSVVPPGAHRNL